MRKRLQLTWMLTASTLLATSFTVTSTAHAVEGDGSARGIATTEEHGRTIYGNDDVAAKEHPGAAPQVRHSNLVSWSSQENRWKAVPSANTESCRAGRSAAAEVKQFYGRQWVQSVNAEILQANSHWYQATPEQIDQSIVMAAARQNVDPNLVRGVIQVESNFNSNAVSRQGAMGLRQLMPHTARELNGEHPFDPEQNADAGVRHLKCLLDQYNGEVNLTLAAYNAGAVALGRVQVFPTLPKPRITVRRIPHLYYRGGDLSQSGASRDPVHVQ